MTPERADELTFLAAEIARQMPEPTLTLNMAEAARHLGMHPATLNRFLNTGQLRGIAFKVEGVWKFSRAALTEYVRQQAITGGRAA